jgi:hypothetical protein
MVNEHDIETFLSYTPVPRVTTGHHRSELKEDLLRSLREPLPGPKIGKLKWAVAACCCMLLLGASGWAAQQLYVKYFEVERRIEGYRTMPDGSVESIGSSAILTTDDLTMTGEEAKEKWLEMRTAIAGGNYVLVDVRECLPGEVYYIYSVQLSDGNQVRFGTPNPLP